MIYTEEIKVPILCPIEFQEPDDLDFYPDQARYIPKIVTSADMNVVIRISEELYNSGNANMVLFISGVNGFITYVNATEILLSTGFYFVNFKITDTHWAYITSESYIKFEIYKTETNVPLVLSDMLADSVIYQYRPKFDKDIKQIAYTHKKNDYGIIFSENENPLEYNIWVESGFVPNGFSIYSEKEEFKDQFANNNIIYGMPYEKYKFTIGDNLGVPNWLIRKINYILLLDTTIIGSKQYILASETSIQLKDETYNGLGIYEVDLQETSNFNQKTYDTFRIHDNQFNYQYN